MGECTHLIVLPRVSQFTFSRTFSELGVILFNQEKYSTGWWSVDKLGSLFFVHGYGSPTVIERLGFFLLPAAGTLNCCGGGSKGNFLLTFDYVMQLALPINVPHLPVHEDV